MSHLVSYERLLEIAERKGIKSVLEQLEPEIVAEREKRKRIPRTPAPPGGISIRAASRKYKIPDITIRRWIQRGYISVIPTESKWEKFITEEHIIPLAKAYKSDPRRGSWAVKRYVEGNLN